jgi:hypothetical protein
MHLLSCPPKCLPLLLLHTHTRARARTHTHTRTQTRTQAFSAYCLVYNYLRKIHFHMICKKVNFHYLSLYFYDVYFYCVIYLRTITTKLYTSTIDNWLRCGFFSSWHLFMMPDVLLYILNFTIYCCFVVKQSIYNCIRRVTVLKQRTHMLVLMKYQAKLWCQLPFYRLVNCVNS